MFIAMSRFKIALGSEDDFVSIWKIPGNLSGYSARL